MNNKNLEVREHYGLKSIVLGNNNNSTNTVNDFDLILEEGNSDLEFIHLTYYDCIDSIMQDGFIPGEGNIGVGVYCANLNDSNSIRSLRLFSRDSLFEGEDKVGIITGKYSGVYKSCVKSNIDHFRYNVGFYLLEDVSKITDLSSTIIDMDELNSYLLKLEKKTIYNSFKINL